MDIKSEKRWKFVPVVDFDLMYVGGIHDAVTLFPSDRHLVGTDLIQFWIIDEKTGDIREFMECERRNLLSYKRRDRLQKVEDTSPLPV